MSPKMYMLLFTSQNPYVPYWSQKWSGYQNYIWNVLNDQNPRCQNCVKILMFENPYKSSGNQPQIALNFKKCCPNGIESALIWTTCKAVSHRLLCCLDSKIVGASFLKKPFHSPHLSLSSSFSLLYPSSPIVIIRKREKNTKFAMYLPAFKGWICKLPWFTINWWKRTWSLAQSFKYAFVFKWRLNGVVRFCRKETLLSEPLMSIGFQSKK